MPVEPKSKYTEFEDGTYEVNRIEFFTKDSDGDPVYVEQTRGDTIVLVARYRTYQDTEEGPPGSIEPYELPLLVAAFGGNVASLPSNDKLKALQVAQVEINNSDKLVDVYVRGGWINSIKGFGLPTGDYIFEFVGGRTVDEDGNPTWYDGKFGTFSIIQLAVAMEDNPFNGSIQEVWLNREALGIINAIAPEAYQEVVNIAAIISNAKKEKGKIFGSIIEDDKGRPKLDKSSLRPADVDTVVNVGEIKPVEHLYQAIADGVDKKPWQESTAFSSPGELADPGRVWAKQNLAPIFDEHGINRLFNKMTDDNIKTVLTELGRDDLARLVDGGW